MPFLGALSAAPSLGAPAHSVRAHVTSWFEGLQREDGSWPADPALGHPGAMGTVIPGRGTDSLSITAAMTLVMLADGNSVSRGRLRDQVRRAVDHLAAVFDRSSDPSVLPPGGALALYALAECAYSDREGVRSTAILTRALDSALTRALEPAGSKAPVALEEEGTEDLGWLALAASVRVESGNPRGTLWDTA